MSALVNVLAQFADLVNAHVEKHVYTNQFAFQHHHAVPPICNVGCNTDGANFAKSYSDTVNVDLYTVDPVTGMELATNMVADARDLPFENRFRTVVLGEILEHMEREDALKALRSAKRALRPGGRVIVTVPHDKRRELGTEPPLEPGKEFYAPGIHACHYREVTREELLSWIADAGLKPILMAEITYCWGHDQKGTGVVAC